MVLLEVMLVVTIGSDSGGDDGGASYEWQSDRLGDPPVLCELQVLRCSGTVMRVGAEVWGW